MEFFTPPREPVLAGTMKNSDAASRRRRVNVYVDESGDRNSGSNRGSDFFTITAVMVEMEHDHQLRIVVEGAKAVWRLKEGRQLHWVEHLRARHEDRRRTLAELLAAVPSVCVVHVVLDKTALTPNSYLAREQAGAYNYALRYLLERVAYAADQWVGGARIADVSLGLVGGVDDRETMRYLNHVATHERGTVPWDALRWPMKFRATSERAGLQAADVYSGMLWAALVHGDRRWFDLVHHQIYRSEAGQIRGFGIKVIPRSVEDALAHLCEQR